MSSSITQGKISISDDSPVLPKIDGIISILITMLDVSRHAEECCLIFRIMSKVVKQPNFSTLQDEKQFVKLVEKYFSILKTHCRGSANNAELVSAAFKAVTMLIGSQYGPLTDLHLKVLLGYAEEDLFNTDRQTAAFPLLHALLKRQNICEEMEYVGKKVLQLAVQADTEAGRNSARNYFIAFLLQVCCLVLAKP
jgi:U3 small nucleolar RNA-associated protein 20